jgi:hypothetical protein
MCVCVYVYVCMCVCMCDTTGNLEKGGLEELVLVCMRMCEVLHEEEEECDRLRWHLCMLVCLWCTGVHAWLQLRFMTHT